MKRARPRCRLWLGLSIGALSLASCSWVDRTTTSETRGGTSAASGRGAAPIELSADSTSTGSGERDTLLEKSKALARSTDIGDLDRLFTHLGSASFLDALDGPAAYEGPAFDLAVAGILRTLAENPAARAQEVLAALVTVPTFVDRWQRTDLLISALARQADPPPAVIDFWRRHSAPGAIHRHTAMHALCENASPAAIEVVYHNLTNALHPVPERRAWMRDPVLRHRNDARILEAAYRMLDGALESQLHVDLVEALFDYRPREWYRVDDPPRPPPLSEFDAAAREAYGRLGARALSSVPMREALRQKIADELESIGLEEDPSAAHSSVDVTPSGVAFARQEGHRLLS